MPARPNADNNRLATTQSPGGSVGWLDRLIGQIVGVTRWLALPLILLLFLQWPLRDLVRCCSREANDLGQIIFALFVAVSVTAVTRERTHLASDVLAQRFSPRTRQRLRQMAALLGVLPWAPFVFVASQPLSPRRCLGWKLSGTATTLATSSSRRRFG